MDSDQLRAAMNDPSPESPLRWWCIAMAWRCAAVNHVYDPPDALASMRFSTLIKVLQTGDEACVGASRGWTHGLRVPLPRSGLSGAAQLSGEGQRPHGGSGRQRCGALLLPDQQDLIDLASQRGIAFAVFADPRLAFAEALDQLHPRRRPLAEIHPRR